jgi:Fe-S cluster biogenesis protein NfuA
MVGRAVSNPSPSVESVPQLPAFERLAPEAPSEDIVAQILAWTKPGEAVLDVDGRGGWVARAAIAEQRRVVDMEMWPLTRLLAEVVLRPPDIRQIDAAAAGIAATRLAGSTVRRTIDAMFAGTCPSCGRPVTIEAMVWEPLPVGPSGEPSPPDRASRRGRATKDTRSTREAELPIFRFTPEESLRPIGIEYPCPRCREQLGGELIRHADADPGDVVLAQSIHSSGPTREAMRTRFPAPRPTHPLVDELIDLHTPRQLAGLHAILNCIENEERVGAVTPALRLALLHGVLLASRLNTGSDRPAGVRIVNGALRVPATQHWRERNPWLAFEDGLKIVKAFVQRVEVGEPRSTYARLATDILALESGTANAILGEATPDGLRKLALHGERFRAARPSRGEAPGSASRVKLLVGQPPLRWNPDRLSVSYHATGWLFGAAATASLPYQGLFEVDSKTPQPSPMDEAVAMARAVGRSLALAAPVLASDARAVTLLDDAEPAGLVAAALGGAAAGCRLVDARLRRGGENSSGILVHVPPTGIMAPGPRTRANRPLPPVSGGAGDPGTISGRGLFAPPERLDEGPFRPSVALQAITDTAVEMLKARGEPATFEQLLGELLLGLDRCGQLARLARRLRPEATRPGAEGTPDEPAHPVWEDWLALDPSAPLAATEPRRAVTPDGEPTPGPVELLLGMIHEELDRPNNRRIVQIEPGRYWLASHEDLSNAEQPLADRVEWSVFSLLSSASGMTRRAAFDRTAAMFKGGDAPDGALIDACLDSYAARSSTPDAIVAFDDLETRTIEHDAIIARLADIGHRLGMRVWIGKRQQARRISGLPLSAWLDDEERDVHLPLITWAPDGELERIDCAWYVRRRATFLFEVEWTAMLGEPILVRHARYPADDKVVRFLVLPPERARLAAYKIGASPLLRKAVADRNWHFLKWNYLAELAAAEELSLDDLEPYVGLEAPADKAGEQLPMFGR